MPTLLILLFCVATPAAAQSLQERMLLAEDARPATEQGLAPLLEPSDDHGIPEGLWERLRAHFGA